MRTIRYQGAIIRDHHILLLKQIEHASGRSYWLIPGGGSEPGETAEQCVRREMHEETCLHVQVARLLLDEQAPPGSIYQRRKTYLCHILEGEARPGCEPEAEYVDTYSFTEVGWFDLRRAASWNQEVVSDPITYPLLLKIQAALGYVEPSLDIAPALAHEVAGWLGVAAGAPGLRQLNRLVAAYVRRVPWESASRIARRSRAAPDDAPALWPAAFWRAAIDAGSGGTCFESNAAFFALLRALGYRGHLTINDMEPQCACHTAIVVQLAGDDYLVDVGIPLHRALRLRPDRATRTRAAFHTYAAAPQPGGRYRITRTRHPKPYIFTLNAAPVDAATYAGAVARDYGPGGLFLDRVVITKLVDEAVWRFASGEGECQLECFDQHGRQVRPLPERPAAALAAHFGMDEATVAAALEAVAAQGA